MSNHKLVTLDFKLMNLAEIKYHKWGTNIMLNIMSKELLHTITETQASAALNFSDVTSTQAKDSLAAPIDSSSTGKEKETSPIDVKDVTLQVKSAPLRKKDHTQATQKEDADAATYIYRHMDENMKWQYD